MTVFRRFAAGMFEGWTRLPLSDRCRVVVVALSVPCAVALTLAVRPSSGQPGSLFLDLEDQKTAAGVVMDPWGAPVGFADGGYTEAVPAVRRAEVIVELERLLSGASTVSRDASARPFAASALR